MATNGRVPDDTNRLEVQDDALPIPDNVPDRWRPCPRSPYHTTRGRDIRIRYTELLGPKRIAEAIADYKAVWPNYFAPARHAVELARIENVINYAMAKMMIVEFGLRPLDLHGFDDQGRPSGPQRNTKLPRGAGWPLDADGHLQTFKDRWFGRGFYPPTRKGERFRRTHILAPRNWGLATGYGIAVLDVDDDIGQQWVDAYEAEFGKLPRTWTQRTGRVGIGLQYYYAVPEGEEVYNTGGRIAPGIDARGLGGFAVCAPSVHPSGRFYDWLDGLSPLEVALAPIAEPLLRIMQAASKKHGGAEATRRFSGVRLGENFCGVAGAPVDALPSGYEVRLCLIGDGELDDGTKLFGFDAPIFGAACSYFGRYGSDADPEVLRADLRAAILAAPKKPGRDPDRYFHSGDEELNRQIERARDFISDLEDLPDGDDDLPEDDNATAPGAESGFDKTAFRRALVKSDLPRAPRTKAQAIAHKAAADDKLNSTLSALGLTLQTSGNGDLEARTAHTHSLISRALKGQNEND